MNTGNEQEKNNRSGWYWPPIKSAATWLHSNKLSAVWYSLLNQFMSAMITFTHEFAATTLTRTHAIGARQRHNYSQNCVDANEANSLFSFGIPNALLWHSERSLVIWCNVCISKVASMRKAYRISISFFHIRHCACLCLSRLPCKIQVKQIHHFLPDQGRSQTRCQIPMRVKR